MHLSKTPTFLSSLLANTPKIYLSTLIQPLAVSRPNNVPIFTSIPKFSFSSLHKNTLKSNYQGPEFYIEQLFTGCLAIFSYYIESGEDCFLVDPLFDVADYNSLITSRGKKLKGIFITHYHADYLSGQHELQKKYHCKIYMGPKAIPTDTVVSLKDKETISLGKVKLECWHTPGHTEESSCLVLVNSQGKRDTIFTGDTLFLNEVGRPDLAVKTSLSAADLAELLFDSLQKLKTLNDDLRIYPGHGSGSACGKSIGKGDYCSLGTQKENNYGLKASDKKAFVDSVLSDMPKPPQYFGYNANINKYEPLFFEKASRKALGELTPQQFKEAFSRKDVQILDIRGAEDLKKGVIKGSLCIGFEGAFANWVGALLDPQTQLIIYGGSTEQSLQTIKRLYRIGYINIIGYASFPLSEWKSQGEVTIPEFHDEVVQPDSVILDVRKPNEWKDNGVVQGSIRLELSDIFKDPSQLDKSKTYITHCASGYRARIAWSYLHSLGYRVKAFPYPFATICNSGKANKTTL